MNAKTYDCPRCNGKGYIRGYSHVRNGVCFKCSGAGKVNRKPRQSKPSKPKLSAEETARRDAVCNKVIEMYKDDPRTSVPVDSRWSFAARYELAVKDGVWKEIGGWD